MIYEKGDACASGRRLIRYSGRKESEIMNRETSILWTELADFPEGWGIKKHFHKDYYHLFCFIKGTGVFLIKDQKYDIVPGSCFLLPPGIVHGLENSKVDELLSYEIKFTVSNEEIKRSLTKAVVAADQGDFIRTCAEFVYKNGLSHNSAKLDKANHFMCALLAKLTDGNVQTGQQNSELIDTSAYSETTISIMVYLESNYMHHIYLDDIARHIEYNRNYMCSLFKNDTGITVIDYLNYVRIRKACEYILYSDIGLSQISYRVGFLNLSHFNRTFKKLVGTTPSAYGKIADIDDNNLFMKNNGAASGFGSRFPSLEQALTALKAVPEKKNGDCRAI